MTPQDFKAWRKHLGLSQTEAGARLGLSRETVGNYERGYRRDGKPVPNPLPRSVELACAAVALGITRYDGPGHD